MVVAVVGCGYRASPRAHRPLFRVTFYGAGSVGAVPPVRCPEIRDVRYSGVYVSIKWEFVRDMKGRPLFGRSQLFGVSEESSLYSKSRGGRGRQELGISKNRSISMPSVPSRTAYPVT